MSQLKATKHVLLVESEPAIDFDPAIHVGYWNNLQSTARFVARDEPSAGKVRITNSDDPNVVEVRDGEIIIATSDAPGLCKLGKIDLDEFLLVYAMVGLVMREALARNDYFQSEDLDHFSDRSCIFSRGVDREHLVSALEHLYVCEACRSFYERIDLKDECSATFKVLRKIDELRRDRSLDRRARTVIEQPESGK